MDSSQVDPRSHRHRQLGFVLLRRSVPREGRTGKHYEQFPKELPAVARYQLSQVGVAELVPSRLESGRGFLMSPTSLESHGCHLIPLS